MRNSRGKLIQNVTIIVLAVALIVMSVGYAAYTQTLSITGATEIQSASWDIHFANSSVITTPDAGYTLATDAVAPTLSNKNHEITFSTNLSLNQEYGFYIDLQNAGTINATINNLDLKVQKKTTTDGINYTDTSVDGTISNGVFTNGYLTYAVTTTDPASIGNTPEEKYASITNNLELDKKSYRKLYVLVKYDMPADLSTLPTNSEQYTFTLTFDASQA